MKADVTFSRIIVKDKANHAVVLDKTTSERLYKDVQSYRLITVATLVDRLKVNGSLARQALEELEEKGLIKKVVGHSKLNIYSMFYPLVMDQEFFRSSGYLKMLTDAFFTLARAVTAE